MIAEPHVTAADVARIRLEATHEARRAIYAHAGSCHPHVRKVLYTLGMAIDFAATDVARLLGAGADVVTADAALRAAHARGDYRWQHTAAGGRVVQFALQPAPDVPHHCERHAWWSSEPCRACMPRVQSAAYQDEGDT